MGIPLHYRKGATNSSTYLNNNMLSLHDNVYAMKIRHYQVMLNNMLTYWIDKYITANYKSMTIKYLNVNLPEFIPIAERKETDLDKGTKYVTMFTQLEQMLGMKIKDEFIISKLFPNDILSDIIDLSAQPTEEGEEDTNGADNLITDSTGAGNQSENDILNLFESGTTGLFASKRKNPSNLINKLNLSKLKGEIKRNSKSINYK